MDEGPRFVVELDSHKEQEPISRLMSGAEGGAFPFVLSSVRHG